MKKLICILIAVLIAFLPLSFNYSKFAYADSTFLRVITLDTPFYKSTVDTTPLFYLPYTYYVNVIDENNDFCHVEVHGLNGYTAIDGFVPKTLLYYDGLEVKSPYLNLKIYTTTTAVLYADNSLSQAIQYIFPERELFYYGHFTNQQGNVYYVSYNNKLGYVKEEAVLPFSIKNHPNELTFLVPDTPPTEEQPSSLPEDFFGLKMIIVACLIFAGIIALFVALKQSPNKSVAIGYYDENDYE